MAIIIFFAFVFGLVASSALVGFILAAYLFRPARLPELLSAFGYDLARKKSAAAVVGLWLAATIPMIAGAAYSMSDTSWMAQMFGLAGKYFWAWVAGAFAVGFLLGLFHRTAKSLDSHNKHN